MHGDLLFELRIMPPDLLRAMLLRNLPTNRGKLTDLHDVYIPRSRHRDLQADTAAVEAGTLKHFMHPDTEACSPRAGFDLEDIVLQL